MPDKCSKHDEVMGRQFDEINQIKIKMENIDTKMDGVIEFKNLVHKIIYGNGTPGLKGVVDSISGQVTKLWFIMGIMLTAVLSIAIVHFWRG